MEEITRYYVEPLDVFTAQTIGREFNLEMQELNYLNKLPRPMVFEMKKKQLEVLLRSKKQQNFEFDVYLQERTGRIIKKQKIVFNGQSINLADPKIFEVLQKLGDISKN